MDANQFLDELNQHIHLCHLIVQRMGRLEEALSQVGMTRIADDLEAFERELSVSADTLRLAYREHLSHDLAQAEQATFGALALALKKECA